MLLRHSGQYALARGLPGLVNLLAIVAFSRILSPEEYGHYALVVAGVGLASATLFQWLRLCLLRFLPAHEERPEHLLSPILTGYLLLVVLTAVGGVVTVALLEDSVARALVAVGVLLVWAQAWFQLNRELARSRLSPGRYGLLSGTKAVAALIVGVALALVGLGGFGALLGLLVGLIVAPLILLREWRGVRPVRFRLKRHGYLLGYGLPLAVNFVMVWVIASSDRLLLGWLLDVDAAGLYAVGYDLANQALGILLIVVNLAAYPLAVRALEREGTDAAREQLRKNGGLLLALALPGAVGLALLAPGIGELFVGPEFRAAAARLIPWVAAGTLLAGVKAYHFDLAFQLGRRTVAQVWVSVLGAAANVALNLLWIPRFGILGAAYATVAAYGLALAGSVLVGRLVFRVPWDWRSNAKTLLATGAMALVLWLTPAMEGLGGLVLRVLLGGSAYGSISVILDVAGARKPVWRWVGRAWAAVG